MRIISFPLELVWERSLDRGVHERTGRCRSLLPRCRLYDGRSTALKTFNCLVVSVRRMFLCFTEMTGK